MLIANYNVNNSKIKNKSKSSKRCLFIENLKISTAKTIFINYFNNKQIKVYLLYI